LETEHGFETGAQVNELVSEFDNFKVEDTQQTSLDPKEFEQFDEIWNKKDETFDFNEDSFFEGAWDDAGNFTDTSFQMGEYQYEENNPFLHESVQSAFEKGLELMEKGSLSLSALAFEAVVQKGEQQIDTKYTLADAWMFLGLVQAENEKEKAAIKALERSLKDEPSNIMAIMV
jgi:peroxin-5